MTCPALDTMRAVDLAAPGLSGVYFVQQGETGPIKIGHSCDVRKRLATLQTGSPDRLRLLLVLAGHVADEKRLHMWFARERIQGGEWFKSGGEVTAFVAARRAAKAPPEPPPVCFGAKWAGFCWGDLTYYGDGDHFCSGHWPITVGDGWAAPPLSAYDPEASAKGAAPTGLDSWEESHWQLGRDEFFGQPPPGLPLCEETASAAGHGYIAGYKHGEGMGRAQMAGDGHSEGYQEGWRDATNASSQSRLRIDSLLDSLGGDL